MATNILDRFKLDGRVALVTGAGSGLGLGFAQALAEAGADVACVDIDQDSAEQAAENVRQIGRRALAFQVDVTSEEKTLAMARDTAEQFGRLDIVMANAGVMIEDGSSLPEHSTEHWNHTIGVNLTGVYLTAKAATSVMIPQGHGKIITTTSVWGMVGDDAVGFFGYTASKGGIIQLTKTLALQLTGNGITANAIAPSFTRTNLGGGLLKEEIEDPNVLAIHEDMLRRTALGRLANIEDLQGIAVFLASPASDYATGETFAVDGGYLAT